jgi:hypothetical protein
MEYPIEACCEPDGRWVARTDRIPGLVVYGESREDALVSARKLSAILRAEGMRSGGRILAFHPGRIPDSSRPELSNSSRING